MQTQNSLRNLSIVLVRTKTPGNIGAVARCMMNMGLERLILVRPPRNYLPEARKLAAGAEMVLKTAEVHPTLQEAIKGHGLVIGASRHRTKERKNVAAPREMAASVCSVLSGNRVALVFGPEVNGLERKDIALCHELVRIPSSGAFPSLNLSHAVVVLAYELFLACTEPSESEGPDLAPAEESENFYLHLQRTLSEIGFLGDSNREHMMFALRQVFGRARMDRREVGILRGILTQTERAVKQKDTSTSNYVLRKNKARE